MWDSKPSALMTGFKVGSEPKPYRLRPFFKRHLSNPKPVMVTQLFLNEALCSISPM